MKPRRDLILVLLLTCSANRLSYAESILLSTPTLNGQLPITSWKTLRDHKITKQQLDFSCGAASMATIPNSFYGQTVTEQSLLIAMYKQDWRASFEDMAQVMPQFGFKAQDLLPVGSN